jgi:hypothetical protein
MTLSSCGCCEPLAPATPIAIDNRPLLSAVAYRVGTFSSFRQTMLDAISRSTELAKLRTRESDDYAITVLEMWATVADVLTFYQERIANESFLRTARLRDSVLRLVRLIDYQLGPGAAAIALLAFTLEKNAALTILKGLRVQSVPVEGAKPEKFETLADVAADARLNQLRSLPAPVGVNPLGPGSTQAYLEPGLDGLVAGASLTAGDTIVLWREDNPLKLELLTVQEVRSDGDQVRITWSPPVADSGWPADTTAWKVGSTFRLFGVTAPPTFMAMVTPSDGSPPYWQTWHTQWGPSSSETLYLDGRYDRIKPGATVLVVTNDGSGVASASKVTVKAVTQDNAPQLDSADGSNTGPAPKAPLTGMVTRLTVSASVAVADLRRVVIYELLGEEIRWWRFTYPDAVVAPAVYVSGRRTGWDSIEVGRAIAGRDYTPGVVVDLPVLTPGRRVLLIDGKTDPVSATVASAALLGVGNQVTFGPVAGDTSSVLELGLDPRLGIVVPVLVSAAPAAPSNAHPEVAVTIGSVGPRNVGLAGLDLTNGAALQAGVQAADSSPGFTDAQVQVVVDHPEGIGHLVVVPGIPGESVTFGPTSADSTTVRELGLSPDLARVVNGYASARLTPLLSLSNSSPQLSVTIGPIEGSVLLGPPPTDLTSARDSLATGLHNAADSSPAFAAATVLVVDDRLLVLPGTLADQDEEYLVTQLRADAPFKLDASAAFLLGNVALASHGESVKNEVIGDGDASVGFQRFALQKKPVTFVPTATGLASSLQLLVNGVLWLPVPTLYGRLPTDRVYTTRIADDDTMTVQFGDGVTGDRPPSGRGNIVATYRQGTGLAGRVAARALTTLLDRPLGLKAVTNPAPADGGADPESIDEARRNAPTTVRTFGRAVSLRDFEDLATASGEIAKANASWVWAGTTRAVYLTVAAQGGAAFSLDALTRIYASLTAARDPNRTLFVHNFTAVPVLLAAALQVDAVHVAAAVAAAARQALLAAWSFDALAFAQSLHLSDAYRVLQQVEGVLSVDVTLFQFKDPARRVSPDPVQPFLRIFAARSDAGPPPVVRPAEQAQLEDPARDLTLVVSGGLPQ